MSISMIISTEILILFCMFVVTAAFIVVSWIILWFDYQFQIRKLNKMKRKD